MGKEFRSQKPTHIETLIQSYFLANVCMVAVFAIISIIVIVAKAKDISFLLQIDSTISDGVRIFSYIVLYSQMIPIAVYVIIDLV